MDFSVDEVVDMRLAATEFTCYFRNGENVVRCGCLPLGIHQDAASFFRLAMIYELNSLALYSG